MGSGSGIERGIGALMSKAGITLLYKLLKYDPEDRITARLALRSEWCQAYKLHKKGQKELREASRDSGVDVNTPGIPETHSTLPKDEKFKIENKNTIPKYKFNQKKQNLRKQIQKVYWNDLLVENNHFLSHHSIIQNYRRLNLYF